MEHILRKYGRHRLKPSKKAGKGIFFLLLFWQFTYSDSCIPICPRDSSSMLIFVGDGDVVGERRRDWTTLPRSKDLFCRGVSNRSESLVALGPFPILYALFSNSRFYFFERRACRKRNLPFLLLARTPFSMPFLSFVRS